MSMGNPSPFDFEDSREAIKTATIAQRGSETAVKEAYRAFALARKAYQVALAVKILELRAEGMAATVCNSVALGDEKVAELRFQKDVAEGVMEAAKSAIWRHTADRKDLARLVDWSRRVAPEGQGPEPEGLR